MSWLVNARDVSLLFILLHQNHEVFMLDPRAKPKDWE